MRILIASAAFPDAARELRARLPDDEFVVGIDAVGEPCEVIVPQMVRIDGGLMDRVRPQLIHQFGVGLERVDREAARDRGITVANVPAAGTGNSEGVGEIAVLHLLALLRRYRDAGRSVADAVLGAPAGSTLLGARVVVLGLGDVGRAVAERLSGFGCELIGVGTRTGAGAQRLVTELGLGGYVSIDELVPALRGARALVVCCTLTDRTRGLVDAEALAALGRDGVVVNVARGPVVDYDALLAALRSGGLAGAGLDVYWDEPIDPADPLLAENVSLTPHVGGVTDRSYGRMAECVVANVERLRRGEPVSEAP